MGDVRTRGSARWAVAAAGIALVGAAAFWVLRADRDPPAPEAPSGAASGAPPPAPASPTLAPATPPAAAGAPRPAATTSPAGAAGAFRIVGRVVRDGSVAVGGAAVAVGPEAIPITRGTSDADGRFELPVAAPAEGAAPALLVARDDASHVGTSTVWWRLPTSRGWETFSRKDPTRIDVGDVFLRDAAALDVAVLDARGFAAPDARVGVAPEWSASETPLLETTADAKGRAHFDGLPAGTVTVYAWVDGAGRGVADAVVPRTASGPLEVALSPVGDVEVTVVEKVTRGPIPGATVTLTEWIKTPAGLRFAGYLPPLRVAPTDARGATRLRGIARGTRGHVTASAPGFGPTGNRNGDDGEDLPSEATSLVVQLEHVRRVSWPVGDGEVAAPPDGTELTLKPSVGSGRGPPSGTARMEGGRVVADGLMPGYVTAIARAPDGSQARLWATADQDEGPAVRFLRRRSARVHVLFPDGAPGRGLWVHLRNQGNNPFGPAVQTDPDGRAVFEDLEAQLADVYVGDADSTWSGRRVASCDLAKGDAAVEVRMPRAREVLVHVLLDGRPGLPKEVVPWGEATVLSRDEAAGTLRLRVTPAAEGAAVAVTVQAPGWIAKDPVRVPPGDGVVETRLELTRAGGLEVQVVAPKSGGYRLRLEKADADAGTWGAAGYDTQTYGAGQAQVDAEGRWRLTTLAPGRYRVREAYSSSASDEVVVAAGATATVRFDVSKTDWVSGRVMFPEGESLEGLTVGLDPPPPPSGFPDGSGLGMPDREGKFRIRVPGEGEVVLAAHGMFLVPAPIGGTARVRAGATDVVLRVVKSPVGVVTFDRDPYPMSPGQRQWVTVSMWSGAMRGAPAVRTQAIVEGKVARFGSFSPGRWTLMLNLLSCVPVVLEDVELGAGETDLGTVAASEGTSLVFEVKVPAGQSAPRVTVSAKRLNGPPDYDRFGEVGATGRVPGLGAGRFRVTAYPMMGGGVLLDREIDVDGKTDVPLALELR